MRAWQQRLTLAIAVAVLASAPPARADLVVEQPDKVQAVESGAFSYNVTITNKCPPDDKAAKVGKVVFHEAGTTGLTITGAPKDGTSIECGLSFKLNISGSLSDRTVAGASIVWVFYDATWLPFGPGVSPYKPPPPPPKKKDYSGLGSNTLAGAGGGALVNLATGVAEFSLGAGALVSGALGALGGFIGTGVWLLIDPPPEQQAIIASPWIVGAIALAFMFIGAVAGWLRAEGARAALPLSPGNSPDGARQTSWERFAAAILAAISLGGLVGTAAGLTNLPSGTMNVVMVLTGFLIGIVDVLIFRADPIRDRS